MVTNVFASLALVAAMALPTPQQLIDRSIAYHDPNGVWSTEALQFTLEVELADRLAEERGYRHRHDEVMIDLANEQFAHKATFKDGRVETHGNDDRRYRDYFEYMLGLPMKLNDPGTRLAEAVEAVTFHGKEAWVVRVTYKEEVGSDIWDFYFDPETSALIACRFFHDESIPDGEYILFEEEIEASNGLKLPKVRRWHMNVDGEWIADDVITSLQ